MRSDDTITLPEDALPMTQNFSRRRFLQTAATVAAGATLPWSANRTAWAADKEPLYKISLAQWSLNKSLFGGKLDNLDFSKVAKEQFGIDAVEYVNQFFKDKAQDESYLGEMKKRAADLGVTNVLIMIDNEGDLGDSNEKGRTAAVEKHHKWVDAAKFLGCHAIRVNARSNPRLSYDEQMKLAADGLRRLTEYGDKQGINVIVENHGGLSSNGAWLAGVMKMVDMPRCGTLPDFGNFTIDGRARKEYDKYQGVEELMPFAKGVSAKSYAFDDAGNETTIDFRRMMKIVLDAGYHGHVGIEYEGRIPEDEGIAATKKLLVRIREEMGKA
jgi:sugar phosphate isomerase/epimerase